ncbi:MAG TPA: glycosyltransferase family 4 protein [bacterium]|nr:glycosyltransferase family 4 protein [bacterium]
MNEELRALNILYILPELTVGGVETHVLALSDGMKRKGHNVIVVSNGGALVSRLKSAGIEHITLPVHRKSLLTVREMAQKVRKIVDEREIHVVHAHSRVPAWVSYFALRGSKTAFVITAHGQYAPHLGSKVMAKGDRIVCVSRMILEHMAEKLGAERDRMRVVYNGIGLEDALDEIQKRKPAEETKKELGISEGVPVIGSIGRLTLTKGYKYFIEAFRKVKETKPDARAILVGDGQMRKELQELAAEYGLENDILFTGVRTDIYDLLGIMDVYVVSSIFEGFPMGCLEAISCRVPIVATNVGGIPEMLEDKRTAFLLEPRDPVGMAEKINQIIDDPDVAGKLSDSAYQDLEQKFSRKKMIQDILDIYYESIREKKGYIGPVKGVVKQEKPRVLLTLPELRVGGVETHVIDLACGLKTKGYDPLVVSFGGKLVEKLEMNNVKHLKLPVHSKSPLMVFKNVGPMRELLADNGIELIHAHSRVPAWICYLTLASQKRKLPFITTCHSTYSVHAGSSVMIRSDMRIAVSEFVRQHMLNHFGTDPDFIQTVHNGISPELYNEEHGEIMRRKYREELGIGPETKVVGMVASLTPRKGYLHFVRAAETVLRDYGDVLFLGVGGGPQREELENQVRESGLGDRFRFLGIRGDVRDLLYLFDIFVLASSSEGLPYVILEAMCMKKAIVTTDVGGIPEALDQRKNAMLVKPGDSDALAADILELLSDPDEILRLGDEARKTVVRDFTVQKMVDKTENIYDKILN